MKLKNRNDFKVIKTTRRTGEQVWKVTVGGDSITTCNTQERAEYLAKNLNSDPWFLDRGQTRADRNSVTQIQHFQI